MLFFYLYLLITEKTAASSVATPTSKEQAKTDNGTATSGITSITVWPRAFLLFKLGGGIV